MNKVGLAIIGSTGIIGRVHIEAMRGLSSCRLVGIHARRQGPLRQQADELGTRMYATLDDALNDEDVDAIVIATPHPSHLEITTRAAAAGKHVLAEKPLGVTPSEAEAQIAACRDAGVKLGVLFNNRFRPEAQKMRQLIDDGAIGEIYRSEMSSAMLRSQDYYDRLDWRGRWDAEGGGALLNQGIHGIDMYQWLAGLPETVFGMVSTLKHDIEVEDYATALLGYRGRRAWRDSLQHGAGAEPAAHYALGRARRAVHGGLAHHAADAGDSGAAVHRHRQDHRVRQPVGYGGDFRVRGCGQNARSGDRRLRARHH